MRSDSIRRIEGIYSFENNSSIEFVKCIVKKWGMIVNAFLLIFWNRVIENLNENVDIENSIGILSKVYYNFNNPFIKFFKIKLF